jgi:hypothetical protein
MATMSMRAHASAGRYPLSVRVRVDVVAIEG